MLSTVAHGYGLEFHTIPPNLSPHPHENNKDYLNVLIEDVQTLLQKETIELLPMSQQAVFSLYFLTPKKDKILLSIEPINKIR